MSVGNQENIGSIESNIWIFRTTLLLSCNRLFFNSTTLGMFFIRRCLCFVSAANFVLFFSSARPASSTVPVIFFFSSVFLFSRERTDGSREAHRPSTPFFPFTLTCGPFLHFLPVLISPKFSTRGTPRGRGERQGFAAGGRQSLGAHAPVFGTQLAAPLRTVRGVGGGGSRR
jgi:hypothetical protein